MGCIQAYCLNSFGGLFNAKPCNIWKGNVTTNKGDVN